MKNKFFLDLKTKINNKTAKLAVIGLGYVGLPLAVEFAKKKFFVYGIDLDSDRVERVKNFVSHICDVKTSKLKNVIKNNLLEPTENFRVLEKADIVFICVPTPLKTKYRPDISFILKAVRQIKKYLHPGQLVILESTTYPETTQKVVLPILESKGLRHGRDFFLVFSPERIDPGNKKFPLSRIPKVIGGINKEDALLARLLYQNIVKKTVLVSSASTAETVKLFENTFRIVNIALVDEMAMICHKMNINIWEVIEAAKSKPFGFMPFYPGPGVGGHCIPKDPLYLYWKARHAGLASRMIRTASEIIHAMPGYIVERLRQLLAKQGITLSQAKILILGVTYKKDVKDLRKSPALEIMELLKKQKAAIFYHDPLIPYLRLGHLNMHSLRLSAKFISTCDCVVILTDHSCIDYPFVLKNSRRIFDTRNVYAKIEDKRIVPL